MEKIYRQGLNSKRTLQAFEKKVVLLGSCSMSSEKGKIMERFKKILEKCWRNPRDDPGLMTSRQKSYHD